MTSSEARPSRTALMRDWASYALGWFLVLQQSGVPYLLQPADPPNETLFWGGMALISVQGGFGVASILAARFGTPGSQSPSPAPESPQQPSSTQ